MFKHLIISLILILLSFSTMSHTQSSSSYLIANTAIKLFDYQEAYKHFKLLDEQSDELNEKSLQNRLLPLVSIGMIKEAANIAKKIINLNPLSQEAWLVYLINSKINNNFDIFDEYLKKTKNNDMHFINFIFFFR